MSQYIVCRANVEVRVSEGRDTPWRITNADHNRDRKRLSMVVKLCERSTGLNFMPKLVKRAVKLSRRNGDVNFMLRLAKKAASLLNASKALSSIPKSVKKVVSAGEPLLRPKSRDQIDRAPTWGAINLVPTDFWSHV